MSTDLLITRAVYGNGAVTAEIADACETARAERLRAARTRANDQQAAINAQTLALIEVRIHD